MDARDGPYNSAVVDLSTQQISQLSVARMEAVVRISLCRTSPASPTMERMSLERRAWKEALEREASSRSEAQVFNIFPAEVSGNTPQGIVATCRMAPMDIAAEEGETEVSSGTTRAEGETEVSFSTTREEITPGIMMYCGQRRGTFL